LDPFCYSDDPLVEVVEDPALLVEFTVQARCAGLGFLELFAENLTSVFSPNFCFQCSCTKAPPSAPSPKRSGRAGDRLDSNLDLMAS
jgi:hypothetical protein